MYRPRSKLACASEPMQNMTMFAGAAQNLSHLTICLVSAAWFRLLFVAFHKKLLLDSQMSQQWESGSAPPAAQKTLAATAWHPTLRRPARRTGGGDCPQGAPLARPPPRPRRPDLRCLRLEACWACAAKRRLFTETQCAVDVSCSVRRRALFIAILTCP